MPRYLRQAVNNSGRIFHTNVYDQQDLQDLYPEALEAFDSDSSCCGVIINEDYTGLDNYRTVIIDRERWVEPGIK